jgi:hypothetical protein
MHAIWPVAKTVIRHLANSKAQAPHPVIYESRQPTQPQPGRPPAHCNLNLAGRRLFIATMWCTPADASPASQACTATGHAAQLSNKLLSLHTTSNCSSPLWQRLIGRPSTGLHDSRLQHGAASALKAAQEATHCRPIPNPCSCIVPATWQVHQQQPGSACEHRRCHSTAHTATHSGTPCCLHSHLLAPQRCCCVIHASRCTSGCRLTGAGGLADAAGALGAWCCHVHDALLGGTKGLLGPRQGLLTVIPAGGRCRGGCVGVVGTHQQQQQQAAGSSEVLELFCAVAYHQRPAVSQYWLHSQSGTFSTAVSYRLAPQCSAGSLKLAEFHHTHVFVTYVLQLTSPLGMQCCTGVQLTSAL